MRENVLLEIKNTFWLMAKIYLLFMFSFIMFRTIFFIYFHDKIALTHNIFSEVIGSYWHALVVDTSGAAYASIIPFFLILFYSLVRLPLFKYLLKFYIYIMLLVISFSYIAELGVYNEWEEKPDFQVLNYLSHPDEILNSNPWLYTILLTFILLVALFILFKAVEKVFKKSMVPTKKCYAVTLAFFVVMPVVVVIGARGGVSSAVVAQADAYFSKQKIYNDAAVNTAYNLLKTTLNAQDVLTTKNPYTVKMDTKEKEEMVSRLISTNPECNTTKILTTTRPNVVLIVLESWAGDFIDDDPKLRSVIPNFLKLSEEGILFRHAYGSGSLSHEGLPAVLSAWPDLFNVNISEFSSKHTKLPSITESLMQNGYRESMFLYGGQLRYGNLTSFIYKNKFQTIEEYKDIPSVDDEGVNGRLGLHDGYMFNYLREKISKAKTPFFASMFTLSSHSPYDQPMQDVIKWAGGDNGFFNSVYYTDKSIGEFIASSKKESWYANTLFIFVADHSHHTTLAWNRNDPRWHHIPMMFYGEVIKKEFRGKTVDTIVSQHDIAGTLLSQLDIDHKKFTFSRDVFCSDYEPSAYFSITNGYGIITPEGYIAYDIVNKRTKMHDGNATETLKLKGQLYLEKLFQTFLDY